MAASVPELTNLTRSIDGMSVRTASPKFVLQCTGGAKARASAGGGGNGFDQRAWCMAMNERAPRHHVVDETIPVDVLHDGARSAADEQRRPPTA